VARLEVAGQGKEVVVTWHCEIIWKSRMSKERRSLKFMELDMLDIFPSSVGGNDGTAADD
jgi:hypothetical protein